MNSVSHENSSSFLQLLTTVLELDLVVSVTLTYSFQYTLYTALGLFQ